MNRNNKTPKKILFLANHFITLFSFRKELILKLVEDGHSVYLSLPSSDENKYFESIGCKIIVTSIDRRGINPLKDLKLILFYKKIIKEIKPDLIFSYTIKPNIYGCFASKYTNIKQICNITGTGSTFLKKSIISYVCVILYRLSIKRCYKVFFQNDGDKDFFIKNKMVEKNWELIPGSGVNLKLFEFSPYPKGETVNFIFIGRVMELKGIDEYLQCAKTIKTESPQANFYIAGWNEEEKYVDIINEFQKAGYINYIGFQKNITDWIKRCHCTILPSHGGEGIPNVLLESAAIGRVCIGSNINGTKDVISQNETGYLFESGNVSDLVTTVRDFLSLSSNQREQMGLNARRKIENEFNRDIIIKKYLLTVDNV